MHYNLALIQAESKVEREAIKTHIRTLNAIIEELPRFDGKVINIKFYNHMKSVLGYGVGSSPKIQSRHDEPLAYEARDGSRSWKYAQWHRTCTVQLDLIDKRLDASKAIEKLKEVIQHLTKEHDKYQLVNDAIVRQFEELERIEEEYRALMDEESNPIVRDHMRQSSHYFR